MRRRSTFIGAGRGAAAGACLFVVAWACSGLLAQGPGAEIQRPLATVVVGGLLTSTAVTLIIMPLIYQKLKGAPAAPAFIPESTT